MNSLEHIPTEIFDQIVDNCHAQWDLGTRRRTLLDLSYASRALHRRAEVLLYHTVRISCGEDPLAGIQSMSLFLRTILTRPRLTFYIVNIHLTIGGIGKACSDAVKPPCGALLNEREEAALRVLVHKVQVPNPSHWITCLHSGHVGHSAALVFSQLHGLKTLSIAVVQYTSYLLSSFWEMMQHCLVLRPDAFSGDSGFKSLTKFEYGVSKICDPGQHPIYMKQLAPLFYIPAVEELKLFLLEPQPIALPPKMPNMPALTSLSLTAYCLKSLGQILTGCPQLKHLYCSIGIDLNNPDYCWLDLGELGRALQPVKETLETLQILTDFFKFTSEQSTEPTARVGFGGLLGTLKDFTKLTTLEITLQYLLHFQNKPRSALAEVLPPHLRELRIREDARSVVLSKRNGYPWAKERLFHILSELVCEKQTVAPELQSIVWVRTICWRDLPNDQYLVGFLDCCEKKGVQWNVFFGHEGWSFCRPL